jgi:hypothetical protein
MEEINAQRVSAGKAPVRWSSLKDAAAENDGENRLAREENLRVKSEARRAAAYDAIDQEEAEWQENFRQGRERAPAPAPENNRASKPTSEWTDEDWRENQKEQDASRAAAAAEKDENVKQRAGAGVDAREFSQNERILANARKQYDMSHPLGKLAIKELAEKLGHPVPKWAK